MLKNSLTALSSLLVVTLILAGCSTIKVTHDFDPTINASTFQTYRFANIAHIGDDQLTYNRITNAMTLTLNDKCYRNVEANTSSMSILIHLHVKDKQRVVTDYQYVGMYPYRFGAGMMSTTRTIDYQEGQLIIDFINNETKETFFRTQATDRIKELDSPQEREAYIKMVVTKMLAAFPSRCSQKEGN